MTSTDTRTRSEPRARSIEVVRQLAASGLAATLAGLLVGGVGGRLVMRASALLNPDAIGRRTEAGKIVGEISAGGTVELLLFGGVFAGMMVAVFWIAVRAWLPRSGPWRSLGASLTAISVAGALVIEADNFDFFFLDPAWVHVLMFTVLVGSAGWLTAWLDTRLVRKLAPARGFTPIAIFLVGNGGAMVFTAPFFVAAMTGAIGGIGVNTLPLWLLTLAAALGTMVLHIRGRSVPPWLRIGGSGTAAVAVLGGLVLFSQQILTIL